MSFLSDDDDDINDFSLPPLHEEVFRQLKLSEPEPPLPPTSGYITKPSTISTTQPLFIIIDYYHQSTYDSANFMEIIVRLWAGNGHEERFVHLRDYWENSKLSIGDTAFVVGDWVRRDETYHMYQNKLSCYINDKAGFFILLPHVLIQGTRLSACQECQRKAYLMDVLQAQGTSFEMFQGTVVHELIQAVLTGTMSSDLDAKLDSILAHSQAELYIIKETAASLKVKLQNFLGTIRKIADSLERGYATSSEGNIFGNCSDLFALNESLPPYGCSTVKEEENLWSFQWGLKGKIDVTLNEKNRLFPLEIKSGSSSNGACPRDAHTLQLSAYIFMMKEKYKEKAGNVGMIYYVKDSVSFQINPRQNELLHIISKRNTLAHAIAHGTVPPTTADSKTCKWCNGVSACAFLETGQKNKSPIQKFLSTKLTYEAKQQYIDFYKKWERTLLDELYITRNAQTMIWLRNLKKRIADGRALPELSVSRNSVGQIELNAKDNNMISASMFSVGDFVMVTRHGTPPIVARGVIIELTDLKITLDMIESSIEDDETDICIDKWESTSSVDICRSNLMSLFAGESLHIGSRLKDLVVECARPHFSRNTANNVVNRDPKLNEDQNNAIQSALLAQDYMLLLGMPGTGKTTALVSLIQTLVNQGMRILIASFTHTAVDNICLKLIKQQIQFIRFGRAESLHKDIVRYSIDNIVESAETADDIQNAIDCCQVYASTCLGYAHPLLEGRGYDVCVIDEASQINLPSVLGPLSRSKRFILVGDHYQLSPIMKYNSGVGEEAPISLFRLLCEANPHAIVTLRTQYRMNNDILRLCNELVYGLRMRTGDPLVANARLGLSFTEISADFDPFYQKWVKISLQSEPSIVVYDTDPAPLLERKGPVSKLNHGEAAVVSIIAISQILCGLEPEKVGIISPYRAQVLYIRELIVKQLTNVQKFFPHIISDVKWFADRIEVHTVDKFQGRDKDCIIFSAVKSNKRFSPGTHITDWQRLNVAVTRAKTKFILVGSKCTLSNSPFFAKMFKILNKESFYDLPNEIDQVDLVPFCSMASLIPAYESSHN